jgi:hypothetical protein
MRVSKRKTNSRFTELYPSLQILFAEYAEAVRTAIRSVEAITAGQVVGDVVTSFMGPSELKNVLLHSIVNVHPAYADAVRYLHTLPIYTSLLIATFYCCCVCSTA